MEKTIKRLRDKLKDRILGQILYIMQVGWVGWAAVRSGAAW